MKAYLSTTLNIRAIFKVNLHKMALELLPEERALLANVLQGNTDAVIAQQLGITKAAAKGRLHRLLRKIGVQNRTQAAVWALANRRA